MHLFSTEFDQHEAKPQVQSMQSKVYFGRDPHSKNEIVIKQINLRTDMNAFIKELRVFQLFIAKRIREQKTQKNGGYAVPSLISFAYTK